MNLVIYILISIATFIAMEAITWFTHKYIMHGFMWYFHCDHHQPKKLIFEKNDLFFLIFAIPSWLCIMLGLMYYYYFVVAVGTGIAMYGLAYFLVHEIFIHQRLSWFKNSNNIYLRALRKAHKMHHKHLSWENGECFGMLFVPFKYFKEAKKSGEKLSTFD